MSSETFLKNLPVSGDLDPIPAPTSNPLTWNRSAALLLISKFFTGLSGAAKVNYLRPYVLGKKGMIYMPTRWFRHQIFRTV